MTALKQQALQMVDRLPEEKLQFVIQFIQTMEKTEEKKDVLSPKMRAFQRLEEIKLHLPEDFDYEKELAEARELKYGSVN